MQEAWIAGAIFLVVYIAVMTEIVPKAVASLAGVAAVIVLGVLSFEESVPFVDFETILLLMSMMVIVAVLRYTGFFSLIAMSLAKATKGSPIKMMVFFAIVAAVFSAFLDNVTTIIILVPITIELTIAMGLKPHLFVVSEAIIANIGGAATLIGDPPNIMIGTANGFSFNQFLVYAGPIAAIVAVFSVLYILAANRKLLKPIDRSIDKLFVSHLSIEKIKFDYIRHSIKSKTMSRSFIVFLATLGMFFLQPVTHLQPGVVALMGAIVILIITKANVEKVLEEIEWSTLLFFAGLFILVGSLEKTGIINSIAELIFRWSGGNELVLLLLILWVGGITSGILDNIPFTATMIPVLQQIQQTVHIPNNLLWWALVLGVAFGGNATIIGASANIIAVGIAKKHNHRISFMEFFKTSFPVFIISLVLSSVYIIILYRWLA
jgi:Na+/H+ antiporter NhaD/arsenite permease-like protein